MSIGRIGIDRVEFWMFQDDETNRRVREGFGHLLRPASRAAKPGLAGYFH